LLRLRVIAWLAGALLAGELAYAVLASPRFAIREVVILGDSAITRRLAAAVRLPPNTNLIRAPTRLLKEQAESLPAVRRAKVRRAFPARLVIEAERREAAAVVHLQDRAVLVDPTGEPFTVAGEWGWGLPELMLPGATPEAGPEALDRASLRVLVETLRNLGTDPRLRPSRLQLVPPGQIEVSLCTGPEVNLGSPDDLEAKLDLLVAALGDLGVENIKYLDLAEPESAYWLPRQAAVATPLR
jgi:cell division septal protein FtsQ